MTIYQISVFLENRAGQLAEVTGILAENGIDLRAIHIADSANYGVLRLIADDPKRASALLLENGCVVSMTPVVAVAISDVPGALNAVLSVLTREGIDIEYMYSSFGERSDRVFMIFRVADAERTQAALTESGIAIATEADLGIRSDA